LQKHKKTDGLIVYFGLKGSACTKALHKMLAKLTPRQTVSREKLSKTLMDKKAASKMLLKLTPAKSVTEPTSQWV